MLHKLHIVFYKYTVYFFYLPCYNDAILENKKSGGYPPLYFPNLLYRMELRIVSIPLSKSFFSVLVIGLESRIGS